MSVHLLGTFPGNDWSTFTPPTPDPNKYGVALVVDGHLDTKTQAIVKIIEDLIPGTDGKITMQMIEQAFIDGAALESPQVAMLGAFLPTIQAAFAPGTNPAMRYLTILTALITIFSKPA